MKESQGQVQIFTFDGNIHVHLDLDGQVHLRNMDLDPSHPHAQEALFYFLLTALKPAFYKMPVTLNINAPQAFISSHEKIMTRCLQITDQTNQAVRGLGKHRGKGGRWKGILFFNVDENPRGIEIHRALEGMAKPELHYENMTSGFNAMTRQWEESPAPYPLDELLTMLEKKRVGRIISANHYLLEKYLNTQGIFLPAVLGALGVEYVIYDNDPYDAAPMGYLAKAFFHPRGTPRFSLSFFHRYWDQTLDLESVEYRAYPQNYVREQVDAPPLSEGFKILILSQSRLANIEQSLLAVLFWLDQMNPANLFNEVQLSYLALRHLILNEFELPLFRRAHYNTLIHSLFYNAMNLLKYEVIEQIEARDRIELYGDQGWETVFPEYYRGHLDNQGVDEVFDRGDQLYLLLNHVTTYFDASGPLYDALKRGVPFVGFPCTARPAVYGAMAEIEYRSAAELNRHLDQGASAFFQPEVQWALSALKLDLDLSSQLLFQGMVGREPAAGDQARLREIMALNQVLISGAVQTYLAEKKEVVYTLYQALVRGEKINYDARNSPYFNRGYLKRILAHTQGEKQ